MQKQFLGSLLLTLASFTVLSQPLNLNRVSIFTDQIGILEYEGKLPVKGNVATFILPDSIIHGSLKVEALNSSQLLRISLIDQVKDVEKPVSNLKELLNSNIGKQVDIEVIEGTEAVTYNGTIISIRTDGEILVIKSKDKIEAIPVRLISHATFQSGTKAVLDQLSTIKTLQINTTGNLDSIGVRIIYALNTIGFTPRYTLFLSDSESSLNLEVTLENKGVSGKNTSVYMINAGYTKNAINQMAFDPLLLGKTDLYESVNQLFKVFEKKVIAGIKFNVTGNLTAHQSGLKLKPVLEIINQNEAYIPQGQLFIRYNGLLVSHGNIPMTVPGGKINFPLPESFVKINHESVSEKVEKSKVKFDGKKYTATKVVSTLSVNNLTSRNATLDLNLTLSNNSNQKTVKEIGENKKLKFDTLSNTLNAKHTISSFGNYSQTLEYYLLKPYKR